MMMMMMNDGDEKATLARQRLHAEKSLSHGQKKKKVGFEQWIFSTEDFKTGAG